jgi:hypothetical protein
MDDAHWAYERELKSGETIKVFFVAETPQGLDNPKATLGDKAEGGKASEFAATRSACTQGSSSSVELTPSEKENAVALMKELTKLGKDTESLFSKDLADEEDIPLQQLVSMKRPTTAEGSNSPFLVQGEERSSKRHKRSK